MWCFPRCPSCVPSARRAATSNSASGLSKLLRPIRNKPISPRRLILPLMPLTQLCQVIGFVLLVTHKTDQALTSFPGKTQQTEEQPIAQFYIHHAGLGLCEEGCRSTAASCQQQPPCFPSHPEPCPRSSPGTHACCPAVGCRCRVVLSGDSSLRNIRPGTESTDSGGHVAMPKPRLRAKQPGSHLMAGLS